MGVSPVRFDGKDLFRPGYYSRRNLNALDIANASGSRLLIIGECRAGVPQNAAEYPNVEDRINWVSNTNELKSILRDGPAYYGAQFAMTPSNQPGVNGAPAVGIIRVNKATKGSLTIADVDSDDVLDISSFDYGLYVNQIRFKVSAGTSEGKKVSVKFEDTTVENDNITNNLFSVVYSGAANDAILQIDPAGNLVVTTADASVPADDITIDLAVYNTINSIVEYFNAHSSGNYTAVLIGDGEFESSKLDKVITADAVDLKDGAYTVKAILQAVLDWFNNSSEYLIADLTSGGERRIPDNMASYEYLAGGTEGAAVTASDYSDALDNVAALVDATFIGCMTADDSVAAFLSAHVTQMSDSTGRRERQGAMGSAINASKSTIIASSKAINNSLMAYDGNSFERYDKNGELANWAGFYKAAAILGMYAGNPVTFCATNKQLNIIKIDKIYGPTDLDDFIKSGVHIAQPSDLGGIRTIRSVSTYQGSNLIANEFSAMRTALHITKDHRTFVEALIGEAGDNTILESIKNRAKLRLDTYVDNGWLVVDPQYGNAYRNFQFEAVGDVVKITYEGTIVVPVNFILVTHNFTVIGLKK